MCDQTIADRRKVAGVGGKYGRKQEKRENTGEMQRDWPCQGLPCAQYSTHLGELVPGKPPPPQLWGHKDKGTCPLPQVPPGCSLEHSRMATRDSMDRSGCEGGETGE